MTLAVCVVTLGLLPVTAATAARSAAPTAVPVVGHHDAHAPLDMAGDSSSGSASGRRSSSAWSGRKIFYTESLPAKWDWSLSTAVANWNSSGGGIQFVRTTKVRKARLNIAYGSIGQAAGMATVGRSRHAWVRLSSSYGAVDSLDAYRRVEVMAVLTHELGHVLGFQHTTTRCSLMSSVLDVYGCDLVPATMPGYYRCRTIDPALATSFVRLYGGRVRLPSLWCPIDPLPSAANRVVITGGDDTPLTVRWSAPTFAPSGSRVRISSWAASTCGAVPPLADVSFAAVSSGLWQRAVVDPLRSSCVSVQLVNRYGAGRAGVARLMRF